MVPAVRLVACLLLASAVAAAASPGFQISPWPAQAPAFAQPEDPLFQGGEPSGFWPALLLDELRNLPPAEKSAVSGALVLFEHFSEAASSYFSNARGLDQLNHMASIRAMFIPYARELGAMKLQDFTLDHPPYLHFTTQDADDTYTIDYALQIDLSGNDVYFNKAGGAGGCGLLHPSVAVLIDVGGHDDYVSGQRCGVNGGGNGDAAGLLVDLQGNDVYLAGGGGTNGGGGSGGVGFLYDAAGDDSYTGAGSGVNGGASFLGIGGLVDLAGDDIYEGTYGGVNGGTASGYTVARSMLFDRSGNDRYTGTDRGVNGGSDSGLAGLIDLGGDDTYIAGRLNTNGGADSYVDCFFLIGLCYPFVSQGLLVDVGGVDYYQDGMVGSAYDRLIAPKGVAGAQLDLVPGEICAYEEVMLCVLELP